MGEDRLSGLDTSFLHMERAGAHMHVASTIIFEGAAPSHGEFRDHIASRLHLVPRFRQKLRFVPFDQGRPVWVDDPYLNLDYHVRHKRAARPRLRGAAAQPRRRGSSPSSSTAPSRSGSCGWSRASPADRFAIVGKSHHALVDGVSGVDITTVLFDVEPEPPEPPVRPPKWAPRPEPTDLQLLGDALRERATSPREIVRGVRAVLRGPRQVLRGDRRDRAR